MTLTWEVAIQLIVGIGGAAALIGLLKVRADKKKILAEAGKTGADASAVVAQTAVALLGPYSDELRKLQVRLDRANLQVDDLTSRLRTALDEVDDLTRELDAFRRGERV